MRKTDARLHLLAFLAMLAIVLGARAAADFVTFESGVVRPLAVSADGNRLFAVNTPGNQLEIFSVSPAGELSRTATVPVGLEPVAVAIRNASEVWVVNHLSDSVSIVDVGTTPPRVTRTLLVGDEPRDIVFAGPGGNRAFITTAHRGQNIGFDPELTTPGTPRADVWVFDATALGASLGGDSLTIVNLFGDTPRALAASADGSTVYAAVFHSGNQTTALNEQLVCDGGSASAGCVVETFSMPGGLPAPNVNTQNIPGPETGLIVKFDTTSGHWEDQLNRNWDNAVRFDLPDEDVFEIDANLNPPAQVASFSGVGTIIFNMVVHTNGKVYVSNTEARNEVRFEGPGILGTTVRGHLHEARVTVIDGSSVLPRHLNKHINYSANPTAAVKAASLSLPLGMAISGDGMKLYVAAFGSNKIGIFNTAQIDTNTFTPSATDHITIGGGLPAGLALHETRNRLFVLSRFDNSVVGIDLLTRLEAQRIALHNPEPFSVMHGRRFLYDAQLTSANGEASCGTCHAFGDNDDLAWDLGNPDDLVLDNLNPFRLGPVGDPDFHPLKGPMTTQTLRGMATHGPMHWRGDRSGANSGGSFDDEDAAFKRFNPAFEGLIGRNSELSDEQMQAFTDFILQVMLPPNPIRSLDNVLTGDEQAGRDFYFGPVSDGAFDCNGCHTLDPANGFFGTDGFSTFENEPQHIKVAHLRNVYTKIGMFGMPDVSGITGGGPNTPQGDQIRGYGVLHDGSVDTVFRFLSANVFGFPMGMAGQTLRRQAEAFVFAFDTDFAPIVGQQITLNSTNAATVGPRIDRILLQAADGECDVVVKGNISGAPRGAYRLASGLFQTDRGADPTLTDAALRASAGGAGQELTYTAVPPGNGERIGIDRDADGALDGDELDASTDPGSDLSLPMENLTCSSVHVIQRPLLRITRNDGASGDERMTLKGEIQLPLVTAVDPLANGFRFKIIDKNGNDLLYRAIGRGEPVAKNAPGWTSNPPKTKRVYKDRLAGAGDVVRITVTEKGGAGSSLFKFRVRGKDGNFQVSASVLPLSAVVVFGGPDEGDAGLCGAVDFNADGGPDPTCRISPSGATITCN